MTSQQHAFCLLVAKGLSQTEAYAQSYNPTNLSRQALATQASRVAAVPAVAAKITSLRSVAEAAVVKKVSYSLADAIEEADGLIAAALEHGQAGAAVSAATLKSKLAGHLVERRETRSGPLEDSDVKELLAIRKTLVDQAAREAGNDDLLGPAPDAVPDPASGNRPVLRAVA